MSVLRINNEYQNQKDSEFSAFFLQHYMVALIITPSGQIVSDDDNHYNMALSHLIDWEGFKADLRNFIQSKKDELEQAEYQSEFGTVSFWRFLSEFSEPGETSYEFPNGVSAFSNVPYMIEDLNQSGLTDISKYIENIIPKYCNHGFEKIILKKAVASEIDITGLSQSIGYVRVYYSNDREFGVDLAPAGLNRTTIDTLFDIVMELNTEPKKYTIWLSSFSKQLKYLQFKSFDEFINALSDLSERYQELKSKRSLASNVLKFSKLYAIAVHTNIVP